MTSRFPTGRYLLDQWMLKTPLFGSLIIQTSLGQFCRTASMLLKAGLSLPSIMEVSIKSTGRNLVIKKSFSNLRARLMQGEGLSLPISQDKLFPGMMVRMVSVGEKTGTLDNALETLGKYYEDRANRRMQAMVGLIEPAMTVLIGIVIAFVMLSMIVPIYSILGKVH
jgi:type IV pilus assembly protein PilC